MAKGGNTWCKKLQAKAKAHAMKRVLGGEKGLLSRGKDTYWNAARAVARQQELLHGFERGKVVNHGGALPGTYEPELDDTRTPSPPKVTKKAPLPRVEGWKPQPYMNPKLAKRIAKYDAKHARA